VEKDLYAILGVKKDATDVEIKKAFHKLAKKHHPDVNQGNKDSEHKFKEVNLAYEVLKDAKKRAQYDQMKAAGANPFSGQGPRGSWRSGGPFNPADFGDLGLGDLFSEIFGGGGGGGFSGGGFEDLRGGGRRGRAGGFRPASRDMEAMVQVGFLDAVRGAERTLELPQGKRLTVKIPEGVDTGTKIRLSGQGENGGDLILNIEVLPHPFFVREGNDIVVRLPVTFSEAVLGGEVDVPTIDGKVVMKIPPGVSSGQRLKLAGRGIRSVKSGTRGDQFAEILIKVPKQPDTHYVESASIARASDFNPRQNMF